MKGDLIISDSKVFTPIGASNHSLDAREEHDFYATSPEAAEWLIQLFQLQERIWEPACGTGSLSQVFEQQGHIVKSTDLIYRGYGVGGVDFLKCSDKWDGDIVTNPPYKCGQEFIEHAIELVKDGGRVFMFMKVTFLEGKKRALLYSKYPPKYIYVSRSRIPCAKNGDFEAAKKNGSSAVAYAWYVWEKGYTGEPTVRWFN